MPGFDIRDLRRRHPAQRAREPGRSAAHGAQPACGTTQPAITPSPRAASQGQQRQQAVGDDRRPLGIYAATLRRVVGRAQVPMDAIERIEVVSGPGGTLWGTNAVNGVINVITKPAASTLGAMADLRWGQEQSGAAFRYGAAMEDGAWRAYGMDYALPHGETLAGKALGDAWHNAQAGFRADWLRGSDAVTVQGDAYRIGAGQVVTAPAVPLPAASMRGANLMGHWTRQLYGERSLIGSIGGLVTCANNCLK